MARVRRESRERGRTTLVGDVERLGGGHGGTGRRRRRWLIIVVAVVHLGSSVAVFLLEAEWTAGGLALASVVDPGTEPALAQAARE